ncbi:MAG: hypothetical protein GX372_01775 [Ignavibacteria bacterium]|jgi:adenine specific DNA methylase Mod|nr:hypothetical protein [Ignavibacteria bacterium]
MKNFKVFLALIAIGIFFVACNEENNLKSSVATKCKYELTVSVADEAIDQKQIITTVVTFPNYDGEIQTQDISNAKTWKTTQELPILTLPAEGVITIKQSLKDGVDFSQKKEYQVGLSYRFVVFSMDSDDNIIDITDREETLYSTIPVENINKVYPDTTTIKFFVDAKGVVSIKENN